MPQPEKGEVLVKTAYAGLNRADLYQKEGNYPLPAQKVPGLELSGTVEALGEGVKSFVKGQEVCAIVSEGAFAEYCLVPAAQLLPVPKGWSLDEAASMPEALFTFWLALVEKAAIRESESLLIHAGASGIGVIGIQLARQLGARVFTTAGTLAKCHRCVALGAEHAIWYQQEDFVSILKHMTKERGIDVIIDSIGGDYIEKNLSLLAWGGRLVTLGFLKGAKRELNLGPLLVKNLSLHGMTLRMRPAEEKAAIAAKLRERVWPWLEQRAIQPVIDQVFDFRQIEEAFARMRKNANIGKLLLKFA